MSKDNNILINLEYLSVRLAEEGLWSLCEHWHAKRQIIFPNIKLKFETNSKLNTNAYQLSKTCALGWLYGYTFTLWKLLN